MPCLAGTNHVSAWAMPNGPGDQCKQEKEGGKEDEIVEFCAAVECLKLSPLPYSGYECRLESDDADSKQENDKDTDIILRTVNGDEDESHLLNLPLHVLGMVMDFSVGVEYLKFRSTCKRCHLAAPLLQWNNGKASKRMQEHSLLSPWQIVFNKH
ncbi:hypothetical protein CTI12_AA004320 [Artemisia annua]|uniref:Uncharacterized protein n=1 Tax=Artemisia annua TaxID=35608 RepID=A0A2U1QJE2_ARTAN|nr:hypothetical protein CTI12_AA004320 [Artemisia annua]